MLAGLKAAATPLTIVTFLVCGATGLALFFDVHSRPMKELHEWSGIAMLGAVALHLLRNWHPTVLQFKRWPLWIALAGGAVATVWMLVFSAATGGGPGRGRGDGQGEGRGERHGRQCDGSGPHHEERPGDDWSVSNKTIATEGYPW